MNDSRPVPTTPRMDPGDSPPPLTTQQPHGSVAASGLACGPRVGRFAVQRFHAKGGLGEVHVAIDEELKRDVALKRMQDRFHGDAAAKRRFLNEAEITAKLEHPGIVPIYGLVQDETGQPCYAMRFIAGESLADAIKQFHASVTASGSLAEPQARPLVVTRQADYASLVFRQLLQRFISVCQTIAYAHSKHVIHRDIKPANVMLGPFGETLVVDWGLARELAVSRDAESSERSTEEALATTADFLPSGSDDHVYTRAGQALGTPGYMSPEQAAGRWDVVASASDIYALGATLYEMLSNLRPIQGANWPEIQQKTQRGDFPAPRQLKPNVPKPLEAICLKAMALKPEERYATATTLAADLEHWLADEPASAYAEPLPVRAGRWARKHKALMATAAAALLTATVGLGAGLYFVNAERERADQAWRAEEQQRQAATTAKEQAETEAAKATAVNSFLRFDLLQLASPRRQQSRLVGDVPRNPDLTVRDLVVRATERIEGKFPDQPQVEAEIRATLGLTLADIGRADLAMRQFVRLREIYTAKFGPDHPNTLQSMGNLAGSYLVLGRLAEALQLYDETLKVQQAKLGPDHADTLRSMDGLATYYATIGQHAKALRVREESLQVRKAKFGPMHPDTIANMSNLACSYTDLGRHAEAIQLRKETLTLRKEKFGPDHPDTLLTMSALACSYADLGRHAEAIQLFEEALPLQRAKLRPDHPETLETVHDLAVSYAALGRDAEARSHYEEVIAAEERRARTQPGNTELAVLAGSACLNLGNRLRRIATPAEALAAYAKAITKLNTVLQKEPNHATAKLYLRNAHWGRGVVLGELARHAEAVQDFDRALAVNTVPEEAALFRLGRAESLARAGDHAKALAEANILAESTDAIDATFHDLACICAAAAAAVKDDAKLQDQYAARAVELLRQAIAKGYKDIEHLKKDDDLKVLREREDFKKLLKESEDKK